ncbi:spore morphogenesis/germination protein YwcE [Metabacillus arenae]|uniref:Spore gernimation protein n=1 Tax=Metabacillus arenae TaxID=2771434 RepID=A0A926NEP8_9BACI|nr:spore morphogenesis/germination protein YwcE [Metabacillus arenae]MBD1379750.1 spore gernimation protein [Metabacillus arenae]
MDMFFAYALIASATPLFLWTEKRGWALFHLPFIALMWVFFGIYLTTDLSVVGYILMFMVFVGNIIFAHVAAFVLWASPILRKRKLKRNLNVIK